MWNFPIRWASARRGVGRVNAACPQASPGIAEPRRLRIGWLAVQIAQHRAVAWRRSDSINPIDRCTEHSHDHESRRERSALITGITGQDGSYLAELLLGRATRCMASSAARRRSTPTASTTSIRIRTRRRATLPALRRPERRVASRTLLREIQPDEVYNLAAQTHVRVSFDMPEYTADVTGLGTIRLLEAIRAIAADAASTRRRAPRCSARPRRRRARTTPFHPRSPYGAAKLYAYWITRNYREAYDLFAFNGILFNHESPRRGETFVTRKITRAVARSRRGAVEAVHGQPRRRARLGLRAPITSRPCGECCSMMCHPIS